MKLEIYFPKQWFGFQIRSAIGTLARRMRWGIVIAHFNPPETYPFAVTQGFMIKNCEVYPGPPHHV